MSENEENGLICPKRNEKSSISHFQLFLIGRNSKIGHKVRTEDENNKVILT